MERQKGGRVLHTRRARPDRLATSIGRMVVVTDSLCLSVSLAPPLLLLAGLLTRGQQQLNPEANGGKKY